MNVRGVESLTQELSGFCGKHGFSMAKTEYWGLRKLEYVIKKSKSGHYVMFCFESSPEFIAIFDRHMKLNNKILRYLFMKVDALDSEPSLMLKPVDVFNNEDENTSTAQTNEVKDKSLSGRAVVDSGGASTEG